MPATATTTVRTRNEMIRECYEHVFPKACAYLHKRGADLETAKELFQEAMVLYYEKTVVEGFTPSLSKEAYLMGMVKNLWLKQQSRGIRAEALDGLEVSDTVLPEPAAEKLVAYLKSAGEKCLNLLQSYYYEKLSMSQLKQKFGFKTERSATVQKYKCLEKVRSTVQQKAQRYEDFLN